MNKMATTSSQLGSERQARALLVEEHEAEKKRVLELETKYNQLYAKTETERFMQGKQLEEAKANYQKLLRRQLEEEKEAWEKRLEDELRRHKEGAEKEIQQLKLTHVVPLAASSASPLQSSRVASSSNLEEAEKDTVMSHYSIQEET